MNSEQRRRIPWAVWVMAFAGAYLMVFAGSALSIYLWAAPFDDWGAIFRALFWNSFLFAAPLGLILGLSWRRWPARAAR